MTDRNYGKVAVIMGGDSNERDISLRSGEAVLKALQSAGVDAHGFDPHNKPLSELRLEGFDRVFIALHGKMGEDGLLQGTLSMMGIPFTGSNMLASAIGMDKVRSKWIWQALNLDVIPGEVIEKDRLVDDELAASLVEQFGELLMVKPASEGSSFGMQICHSQADVIDAVNFARGFSERVLVETMMTGPEYTVAVLGNSCLPSIRIQPSHEFYDFEAKYDSNSGTEYFCPSGLDDEQEEQLQTQALKAFLAVGCSGWGRVDFMHDEQTGKMHLMELNTVPGMTETSLVPKAAAATGIGFEDLCLAILDTSLE